MKLAVFGATGGTGRQVVWQALERGDLVQVLVRNPTKLDITHPNLTVITGDVLDPQRVAECVAGVEAVVCSLGNTPNNPTNIVTQGTQYLIPAMKEAGVSRLVVVSSIGIGDSQDQVPFAFKMLMRTMLRAAMADKEAQEELVRNSGLDWIIVRPGGLTDGPKTGQYTFGLDRSIMAGRVSRADVAEFVLRQLMDNTFLRQTPAIT